VVLPLAVVGVIARGGVGQLLQEGGAAVGLVLGKARALVCLMLIKPGHAGRVPTPLRQVGGSLISQPDLLLLRPERRSLVELEPRAALPVLAIRPTGPGGA
jgi:hypothetical protein